MPKEKCHRRQQEANCAIPASGQKLSTGILAVGCKLEVLGGSGQNTKEDQQKNSKKMGEIENVQAAFIQSLSVISQADKCLKTK